MSSTGIGSCFARICHPTVLSIYNGQMLLPYVPHLIFFLVHSILKLSPLPIERGIKLLGSTGASCMIYALMTGSCHPLSDPLHLTPWVLPKLLHVPVNGKTNHSFIWRGGQSIPLYHKYYVKSSTTNNVYFLIEVHLRENDATVPPYAIIVIWKYENNRRYGMYGVGNSRKRIVCTV